MKQLIKVILLISVVTLFAPAAYGCFCVMPEVPDAFQKARAVFLGEVVEIAEPITSDVKAPPSERFFRIKFKVKRSWKGVPLGAREFTVLAGQGRFGCFDFTVVEGLTYLVYADPVYADPVPSENWSLISFCNRTSVVTLLSIQPRPGFNGIDPFLDIGQLNGLSALLFSARPSPVAPVRQCPNLSFLRVSAALCDSVVKEPFPKISSQRH